MHACALPCPTLHTTKKGGTKVPRKGFDELRSPRVPAAQTAEKKGSSSNSSMNCRSFVWCVSSRSYQEFSLFFGWLLPFSIPTHGFLNPAKFNPLRPWGGFGSELCLRSLLRPDRRWVLSAGRRYVTSPSAPPRPAVNWLRLDTLVPAGLLSLGKWLSKLRPQIEIGNSPVLLSLSWPGADRDSQWQRWRHWLLHPAYVLCPPDTLSAFSI